MNFKEEVLKLGIELKDGQLDQFEQYYRFLIEENRKMNLTAITEQEEVYRKHFWIRWKSVAFYRSEVL